MFFPNATVEIYDETADAEQFGVDEYTGEPKKGLTLQSTVQGDLQPLSPGQSLREFGAVIQGTYRLFLPINTQISCSSQVKVDGQLYQVQGDPMKRTALLPHIKVLLIRERTP